MSGDIMSFPATPDEFVESYSFRDKEQVYTNGVELIPAFRVKQMIDHYFQTVHGRCDVCDTKITGRGIIDLYGNGWQVCIRQQGVAYDMVINHCGDQISIPIMFCPECGACLDGQDANVPTKSDRGCSTCANDGFDMPQCRECTEHPGYPWYKRKDGGAEG